MTNAEFYQVIKEYAKKEMVEQGKKYTDLSLSGKVTEAAAHLGASNEAEKFYRMIESLWVDAA